MVKIILLLFSILLTSCFYLERVVDFDASCDELNGFCWPDYPYNQKDVGDSVVPYYKYYVIVIKNNDKYGIYLPKDIEKSSAKYASLVDECGKKIDLIVTLKNGQEQLKVELDKIFFSHADGSDFFIKIETPSIPLYEVEYRFEKENGEIHVFNSKVTMEVNHKVRFLLFDLLAS